VRATAAQQADYERLAAGAPVDGFEHTFFDNMVIVLELDRRFTERPG
jgi:hypothetical protein